MGRLVAYPYCHPPGPNPISKWGFCITRFWFPFRRPHAGSKSKGLKPETSTLRPGNLPEKPRPSLKGSPYTRRGPRRPAHAWPPGTCLARGPPSSGGRRRGSLGARVCPCRACSVLARRSHARGLLLPGPRPLPGQCLQPGRRPRGRRCHSGRRATAAHL